MPSYVFFSILAASAFAFSSLINKFTSKHKISNNWVLLVYYYLCYVPALFLIPIFLKVEIPSSGWIFIVLYALFFFLGNIFFTKAIYKLDISTISPFYQLQAAFVAILAFSFLSERFPLENYLFITLVLAGAVLVTLDEKMNIKSFFQTAVLFIILQQFFHAIANLFGGFALKEMDSFTFIFWGDLIAAGFALLVIPIIGIRKFKLSFHQIKPLFVSGLFSIIGATSLFTAFSSNLTVSSALSLLTSPIVLVLSTVASVFKPSLLEHHTTKVYLIRVLGIILVLIGAINLAIR